MKTVDCFAKASICGVCIYECPYAPISGRRSSTAMKSTFLKSRALLPLGSGVGAGGGGGGGRGGAGGISPEVPLHFLGRGSGDAETRCFKKQLLPLCVLLFGLYVHISQPADAAQAAQHAAADATSTPPFALHTAAAPLQGKQLSAYCFAGQVAAALAT